MADPTIPHPPAVPYGGNENHFARLLAIIPGMLYDYVLNPDGSSKFLYVGPKCQEILELTEHELLADADKFWELVFPEDMDRLKSEDSSANEEGISFSSDVRIRTQSGKVKWIQISSRPNSARPGELVVWSGFMLDITERKNLESELRIAAVAFDSHEGMIVTDVGGTILRVNRAFTEITGYTAEEVVGENPRMLQSGRHDAAFYAAMWGGIYNTDKWDGEIWNRRKSGEIYPERLSITAVRSIEGSVTHYVGTFIDITLARAAEDEIKCLAFYDPLTRLPNRRLLKDRLSQTIAASKRNGRYGAVMFLDLDNFKPLNDTHGHSVGDSLLVEVARRLTNCVREVDTVARFGGDEFVVVLSELDESKSDYTAQVSNVAEKIRNALAEPYLLTIRPEGAASKTVEHHCAASIGVVLFNSEVSAEDALKYADMAMYQAKAAGRNQIQFYEAAV